jgi:hypothetical protein
MRYAPTGMDARITREILGNRLSRDIFNVPSLEKPLREPKPAPIRREI